MLERQQTSFEKKYNAGEENRLKFQAEMQNSITEISNTVTKAQTEGRLQATEANKLRKRIEELAVQIGKGEPATMAECIGELNSILEQVQTHNTKTASA